MKRMSEKEWKRIDGGVGCIGYELPRPNEDSYIKPSDQNGLSSSGWGFVASYFGYKRR